MDLKDRVVCLDRLDQVVLLDLTETEAHMEPQDPLVLQDLAERQGKPEYLDHQVLVEREDRLDPQGLQAQVVVLVRQEYMVIQEQLELWATEVQLAQLGLLVTLGLWAQVDPRDPEDLLGSEGSRATEDRMVSLESKAPQDQPVYTELWVMLELLAYLVLRAQLGLRVSQELLAHEEM